MSRPFDPFTLPLVGSQLIEASAGTGKTYSIASLYLLLLLKRRLTVEQILVVTFTEAATAELHARIRNRVRDAVDAFAGKPPQDEFFQKLLADSPDLQADHAFLLRALGEIDNAAISTIHGFCHRVLQQHALDSGLLFDLELTGATSDLLQEVVEDFWVESFYHMDRRLAALVRKAIDGKDLIKFAGQVSGKRDYPVVGGDDAPMAIAGLVELCDETYQQARQCWQAEKATISQLFDNAQGLAAQGKRLLADGLLARIDDFLAGDKPLSYLVQKDCRLITDGNLHDPGAKIFTATAIKKGQVPENPFFTLWHQLVTAYEQLGERLRIDFLKEAALYVRSELPARLVAHNLQSFDDLLHSLDHALGKGEGHLLAAKIRQKHPAALIDEFQDTDPVQYRIFNTIYQGNQEALFLIGDPKQAIYSFRGADIYAYLNAADHAARAKYTMFTNWRADALMVEAVNSLFTEELDPFFDRRIACPRVNAKPGATDAWHSQQLGDAPLQFLQVSAESFPQRGKRFVKSRLEPQIAPLIAADIARLLDDSDAGLGDNPVRPKDIAVLVRKNEQADEMQQELRRLGIAAVLQSRASVYQSREATEVNLVLKAAAEPGNETKIRNGLATSIFGLSANEIDRLNNDENGWLAVLEKFQRYAQLWQTRGIMQMFRTLAEENEVYRRLLAFDDGDRRLTNIRHLTELLQQAESSDHLSPVMLLGWLGDQLKNSEIAEAGELRLESDEDAVQLITVHRSKGLEFPIVYCPYLWQGVSDPVRKLFLSYHDPNQDWQGKITVNPQPHEQEQAQREEFAEQLRLFYVAVTRARHCCKIFWAPIAGYDSSPLAYLVHGRTAPSHERLSLAAWQQYLSDFTLPELVADLTARIGSTPGWHSRTIDGSASKAKSGKESAALAFVSRQATRKLDHVWRIGSFSHMIAGHQEHLGDHFHDYLEVAADEEQGRTDHDELILADFPKGPVAGNFFHNLFEHIDFSMCAAPETLEELVAEQLTYYGYDQAWLKPVTSGVFEVLTTRLHQAHDFCLKDISADKRLNEMAFTLPVASSGNFSSSFDAKLLAQPFIEHNNGLPPGYGESLRSLPFVPLQGYLKGFVDLIFEHNGKWFIVDYKSNHLGNRRTDYQAGRLMTSMAEHHYFLQYHLYTVALHRYLSCRLPGYCYQDHFGGVFYLYLKGIHSSFGPDTGVFYDLPPFARIEQLSTLIEQAGGAR
ncbi:MAG: exodeoxyribonuclease V subunit beta [Desulfobulbaceae bacterium]|nr:exodeoxyribonuclease V subunit beta [Desulfobulbaceae bacterium]HIJ77834.1 exodeoxyribonuclease V subunit beta [Deltaproteobacteria bacterium]